MTDAVSGRLPDRKEAEVRRMLEIPHPPVPADLAERAIAHGRRLVRRRLLLRRTLWALLLAAVVAVAIWAAMDWPTPAPLNVTPPLESW
ncbi:hypothetical protein [Streptantibioticus ferralitis]|uniref:Uncharacterized protein n=1 Tax=Streptantibioticus ferralitis TaxID=236510 RepID=A0ABT5Z1S6_9ACTN|nr:hypothetical protein [Streptantibioticus ferralitis]MDF2257798.1 hypothetical protein [Streptantibioticus ferralitis]